MAIEQALTVLSWFENLQKEEQPPEYLWEDAEGLEQWWARIEAKRNDGVDTSRGAPDPAQSDQAPASKMVENDQARFLREAMK